MSPPGGLPGYASDEIFTSLRTFGRRTKLGRAVGDNKAFRVKLPHRESFSPDVAFYIGPDPGMKFYEGAPVFAVEVRSEGDYGPKAEKAMAEKRADYFAAGTLVVWDVDLLSPDVVKSYGPDNPIKPVIYRRGDSASAEPALPGWRFAVDDLFPDN
jgi:Uma2 family endonuclease